MSVLNKKCERKCCVPECTTKITENTIFHKFPNDATKKTDWIRACNITTKLTSDMLICGSHFTENDYKLDTNSGLRHLKPSALPKQSLVQNSEEYIMIDANKQGPAQYRRKCSVPQCIPPVPYERRSYHLLPKLKNIKDQWIRACGVRIVAHPYGRVCSAHFQRSDFITDANSRKQVLKTNAVPTLNLPKYTYVKSEIDKNNKKPGIKSDDDEKVETIIYVPENCSKNIINTNVIGKQDNSNLDNKIVFSQVQNSATTQSINNTKIQSKASLTSKVVIASPKHKKPELQKSTQNTKNVQRKVIIGQKTNVNEVVHQNQGDISDNVLHQTNNVKIRNEVESSLDRKPILRAGVSAVTLCADCGQYCKIEDQDLLYKSYKNPETLAAELLLELQETTLFNEDEHILLTKKGIEICNKAIQKQNMNLMEILTNDDELMAFTGINFALLEKLTKWVSDIEGSSSARYNTPVKTRIALCLCKLRINMSFACLGMLFGLTQQLSASNFFSMVRTLSVLMDETIQWPNTEELLKDLPERFQSFKQTRIILNCSEMQIEKQRCSKCQQKMIDNNVTYQAVKLVLGVAPSGLVIFKSNVFESSANEVSVFTQTNIMSKLDPLREAIMADKTLNIEAECAQNNVTLIKLPKLGKNKQFSKHDVELIKNISTARIHVDRTLQRFKTYKITQTKVHWRVLPYLDEVCNVIAGIVNLRNPIPPNEIDVKSVKRLAPIRKNNL